MIFINEVQFIHTCTSGGPAATRTEKLVVLHKPTGISVEASWTREPNGGPSLSWMREELLASLARKITT